MARTGIEELLVDRASRQVLLVLKSAIDVALNGQKPRKRGRPKKAVALVEGEAPKRKRGRPKKVETQGSQAEHEKVAVQV